MKPHVIVDRESAADGSLLTLQEHDGDYTLLIDGEELMSSRAHGSETALARLTCEALGARRAPRVLVGGLGFGFTLRAALDGLPAAAEVVVCEVFEMVVRWNRGELGRLAGRPLADPRVRLVRGDVRALVDGSQRFDAIVLDVDNGPWGFSLRSNDGLYSARGLERIARSLLPRGVLTVWSETGDPAFERRLRRAGFDARTVRVAARTSGKGARHAIFVARRR